MKNQSKIAPRRKVLHATLALSGGVLLSRASSPFAQSGFPSKPIRFIVGFPAGGATDQGARAIAQFLSNSLGKQVVVDNRAGADSSIAGIEVARSAPDGHTIFFATSTALSFTPNARRNPPYDPVADFTPISHLCTYTFVLVSHKDLPATSMKQFIEVIRANPGKYSYASGNSTGIVTMSKFLKANSLEMVHVPYKGEAQAALDLAPGRVQAMLVTPGMARTVMKDEAVRPLAVLLPERTALMPDVPTFVESGQSMIDIALWGGIVGPPGMPPELVDRWSREFAKVIANPELKAQMDQLGMPMRGSRPDEFGAFIKAQKEVWGKTMKEANITVD